MLSRAKAKVFMFDSSKYSKSSAYRAFSISDMDYLITDFALPDKLIDDHKFKLFHADEGAHIYIKYLA